MIPVSGIFFLDIGNQGPHRFRSKRPFPKFLKKAVTKQTAIIGFYFIQLTSRHILIFYLSIYIFLGIPILFLDILLYFLE